MSEILFSNKFWIVLAPDAECFNLTCWFKISQKKNQKEILEKHFMAIKINLKILLKTVMPK